MIIIAIAKVFFAKSFERANLPYFFYCQTFFSIQYFCNALSNIIITLCSIIVWSDITRYISYASYKVLTHYLTSASLYYCYVALFYAMILLQLTLKDFITVAVMNIIQLNTYIQCSWVYFQKYFYMFSDPILPMYLRFENTFSHAWLHVWL